VEDGFVPVARVDDIPPGTIRNVRAGEEEVALANWNGGFYAVQPHCLHLQGPLGQGKLDGCVLTCPWHGWQFDVTTGKASMNPNNGVACYPTEVRGDEVFVDVG